LETDETLVPPNLSTTQDDKLGVAPAVEFATAIEDPIRDAGGIARLAISCDISQLRKTFASRAAR
jgi:hypothetical protein